MVDEMSEEIKKLILSVITSTPDSVTISRLRRDFIALVGSEIPFRKLGFENLEIYLLSISDTVVIRGRGPDAIVKARPSEKSAHVENLIANQKKNTGNRNRGPPRRWQHRLPPPPRFNNRSFNGSYRLAPPPGLFIQRSQFSQAYGVQPLMSQYHPPPISHDGRYDAFKPNYRPTSSASTQRPHQQDQQPNVLSPVNNNNPSLDIVEVKAPSLSGDRKPTHCQSMVDTEETATSTTGASAPTSVVKAAMERISITPSRQVSAVPAGLESASDDSNDIYDEGDDLFTDSDDDIPVPNAVSGKFNPIAAFASTSSAARDADSLEKPTTFEYNIRVPRDVQDNLVKLVMADELNEGIWCGRLPDIYKEQFGTTLSADRYGFPSLLAMCLELPCIFHCIQIQRGDYKIFDRRKAFPRETVKLNTFVRKIENINATQFVQAASNKSALPEGHMSMDYFAINDQIPRIDLSSLSTPDGFFDVKITEVYDPSKFWLYLVGAEYSDKLDNMMDEIQVFYRDNNKILAMPREEMKVGLLCCATYFKEYHRAVIIDTNLPKPHLVKVFFIDYGTVGKVAMINIMYLHRQFGSLPQQALRARLAAIYPREAKTPWSRAARRRFFELINDRQLVAEIDKINEKRQEMDIFLTDTLEDDIHIQDTLVVEGLAIFTKDPQTPVNLDWRYEPIVQYIHLYPTFQEIETGRVHNITEMGQLEELHVPYYIAYNHYFYQKEGVKSILDANCGASNDIINDILETNATVDATANWVRNIDNSNISDTVSIADIEAVPFRRILITECDGDKFLLIRYNNKVHLVVEQLKEYFKMKDLSIIEIRRLCVHIGINIPCLTKDFDRDLFLLLLGNEHFISKGNAIHLLQVENVPIFYERICNETFSLDIWPNIEKILSFSSDIWVK